MRGMGFFRVVFFLPQAIVTVVVAIVWTWLMAPSGTGTINELLHAVGLGPATGTPWLGSFSTALPAVGLDRRVAGLRALLRAAAARHPAHPAGALRRGAG